MRTTYLSLFRLVVHQTVAPALSLQSLIIAIAPTRLGVASGTAVGAGANVQSDGGTALGSGARVAGEGSVAIGRNARAGTVGVFDRDPVMGVYNVVRVAVPALAAGDDSFRAVGTFTGTAGNAVFTLTADHATFGAAGTKIALAATPDLVGTAPTPGQPGTYDIRHDPITVTALPGLTGTLEGNVLTLSENANVDGVPLVAGDKVNLGADTVVVTSYSPAVVADNTFSAANNAVAIGDGAAVVGDNGIAIGAGAVAEANQIRIGSNQTDVQIGAYNLAEIRTNTADIQTNRAGIASAVAIANLPAVQGPTGGWSLALGSFDGETAIAGGINFDVLSSSIVKISVASSDGETSAGIGFGMGF